VEAVDVAIIGGGASGTLTALQLERLGGRGLKIALVEKSGAPGRGLAYSTPFRCHVLNVPAGRMSAHPDQPGHFVQWLASRGHAFQDNDFVSRSFYGEYLEDLLARVALTSITGEVTSLTREGNGFTLTLGSGSHLRARTVVLSPGNFFPPTLPIPGLKPDWKGFVGSPWKPGALEKIPSQARVLLLGSGLTMIDVALALRDRGHEGPMTALSRHGLVPQRHAALRPGQPSTPLDANPLSVRDLLRALRSSSRADGEWRHHLDALRSVTSSLWESFPVSEQRRFLRHLRAYWDVHRYRMAPEVAAAVDHLRARGALQVLAGRWASVHTHDEGVRLHWKPRGARAMQTLEANVVINCTGPAQHLRDQPSGLLRHLLESGLGRPDRLGMGLDTTREGALISSIGQADERIRVVGALRRGTLWESTAIPELRQQAQEVARGLVQLLEKPELRAS